jgi:Zn-dependent protease
VIVAIGNFTMAGLRIAAYMLVSLLIGMSVREYARASAIVKLGDMTPRLWGRLSFHPRVWFEPFGSGLVPALTAVLWAVGVNALPGAAYAKPAPLDPRSFRRYRRDIVIASCAGPLATLALGIVGGLVMRTGSLPLEPARAVTMFAYTSMSLTVFHLLPIPGLDGARMVALLLPPAPAEIYRNADKYLPLFVLVILFVFSTLVLGFLTFLAGALCEAAAGIDCRTMLLF